MASFIGKFYHPLFYSAIPHTVVCGSAPLQQRVWIRLFWWKTVVNRVKPIQISTIFSEFCPKCRKNYLINCRYENSFLTPGPLADRWTPDPTYFSPQRAPYRYRPDPLPDFRDGWGKDSPHSPSQPTYASGHGLAQGDWREGGERIGESSPKPSALPQLNTFHQPTKIR